MGPAGQPHGSFPETGEPGRGVAWGDAGKGMLIALGIDERLSQE